MVRQSALTASKEQLHTAPSLEPSASLAASTADLRLQEQGDKARAPPALPAWNLQASEVCRTLYNPLRSVTDALKPNPYSSKQMISLGQGDPTVYGFFKAPDVVVEAVVEVVRSGKANGYVHSCGPPAARQAVADHFSPKFGYEIDATRDVIMTVGCNQALELSIQALCNPGSNVLVPRPGYPWYGIFLRIFGVEARFYDLLPNQDWQVDCSQLARLRDVNTAAIVICNPGNPTGSVFSRKHLEEILASAEELQLPVIADEVYAGICFRGAETIALASLDSVVPVLSVGSLSKKYLVPGWRLGWLIFKDPAGILERGGIQEGVGKLLGSSPQASSVLQALRGNGLARSLTREVGMKQRHQNEGGDFWHAALPRILQETPASFFKGLVTDVEAAANLCYERACRIQGLECPSRPKGAMYIMVRVDSAALDGIDDDLQFCVQLLQEESVVLIPGAGFEWPGWARVLCALPTPVLEEAWDRIEAFCIRRSSLPHPNNED